MINKFKEAFVVIIAAANIDCIIIVKESESEVAVL
jgi:hypothetical protein